MLHDKLIQLRELESRLIHGGGKWFELVPTGMHRSTLQRNLQLLESLGVVVISTNPDGGAQSEFTTYRANRRTAFFRHPKARPTSESE